MNPEHLSVLAALILSGKPTMSNAAAIETAADLFKRAQALCANRADPASATDDQDKREAQHAGLSDAEMAFQQRQAEMEQRRQAGQRGRADRQEK